jgi:hypothetical protein
MRRWDAGPGFNESAARYLLERIVSAVTAQEKRALHEIRAETALQIRIGSQQDALELATSKLDSPLHGHS